MKNFKNKKPLAIFLLFLTAVYLFSFILLPLIHRYYLLNKIYAAKLNTAKLLKIRLINTKRVKLIKFRAGYHRLSTNLLTILSYINYLNKLGWNIKVKISHNKRFKHINFGKKAIKNAPGFKRMSGHSKTPFTPGNNYNQKKQDKITKSVISKRITISLNKVSNVSVVFSLIKTFRAFPVEIKKISINTNKNINVVMNLKLISLKGLYK